MKFKGTVIGEAARSMASLTFSHNRGGQYIRQRVVPVDPQSSFQTAIRNFVADLTARWNNTLTAAQRAGWDTYAQNVLLPDVLGEPRNAGGLGMYTRSNVPRLQAALSRIDNAPVVFNLGSFTTPTVAVDAAADDVDVTFTAGDPWNVAGGAMIVYASRPQSASINFFKGPYRLADSIDGVAISPATILLPFPVAAGNRVFFQFRVSQSDGRLSAPFRLTGVAA